MIRSNPHYALGLAALTLVACTTDAPTTSSSTLLASTSGDESSHATFPIRLERPSIPGARYRIEEEENREQAQTIRMNGEVVDSQRSDVRLHFVAEMVVVEVDGTGNPTRTRYRVESLTLDEGDGAAPLLGRGTAIEVWPARNPDEARILVDGRPIADALREKVASVLSLRSSSASSNDDALFGTDLPRAVHESWSPDPGNFARQMSAETPITVEPAGVTLAAEVTQRRVVDGQPGLDIRVDIDARDAHLPGMPASATVRQSRMTMVMEGFFPDDVRLPRTRSDTRMTFQLVADIRSQGATGEMTLSIENRSSRSITPLP